MHKKFLYLSITISVITLFIFLFSLEGVYAHGKEKHSTKVNTGDITYSKNIQPLFKINCAKCHGADSPEHMAFIKDIKGFTKKNKGPKMSSYSHLLSFVVWPDTGSLMRAIDDGKNTENGKPGKMYKNLGKSEKERQKNLKLFKEWVKHWTLKEWANINKDEINKMRLTY